LFDILKTGIDGLDAILAGGIRYPTGSSAFVFVTGGPGSGKTVLGLELVARAWLDGDDGSTSLYYSVEHSPEHLHKKLEHDFAYYGAKADITVLPQEVPSKLCIEARTQRGRTRLVLTQANPASLQDLGAAGTAVDVDWILAEIGNYRMAGPVRIVCVDNIGLLLTDLDYFGKRAALLATRRALVAGRVHGIFVQELTNPRDLRLPSAEEFSTDLLIELSFQEELAGFKARSIEIQKARHQYYYRGRHHFSIAGRGVNREVYLGARSERGPGIHIYPSVAAQLSIARDSLPGGSPRRGTEVLDMGHPDLLAGFLGKTGPTAGSSTVLLAEPGTRYTYLALRFLAAGHARGETTLMVSTKEDRDALTRICEREPTLRGCLDGDDFQPEFRVLYLHPEFISPGKFTWDLLRLTEPRGDPSSRVARLAFDNIYRMQDRFPLLADQNFMIPALIDMLRYRSVTPLFIDLVPPGSGRERTDFDPAPYMTTFDNVYLLYLDEVDGTPRPHLRVVKSTANEFTRRGLAIDYRR
jgi:KaiC/GvpD/RAD55 family RecA-like ATPase